MRWNIGLPPAEYYDASTPGLDRLVREVESRTHIAIDTETTGLTVWKCVPLFWSIAWEGRRICLKADCLSSFRRAFDDPSKHWIFANAKFDMHMMANLGYHFAGKIIDTQVMHCLLYEEEPHKLEYMGRTILGWVWKDLLEGWDKQKMPNVGDYLLHIFATDPKKLIEYAATDAYGTYMIYLELKKKLEATYSHSLYPEYYRTLWDIFYKTEAPFTKVLWKCERNGIYVDLEYLKSKQGPVAKDIAELEKQMTSLYQAYKPGKLFKPSSPLVVRDYFINHERLKPLKFTKGGKTGIRNPSTDYDFLDYYKGESDMARLLLQFRDLDKLHGTYLVGLQESESVDPRSYIHTSYNQDVARTGRLSSREPNLQNLPNAESDKHETRKAFRAEPGTNRRLICADYAQLEMRLLACAAMEPDMIDIFLRGWDIHMGNAAMVFNIPYEDIKAAKNKEKEQLTAHDHYCLDCRRKIKNVGFGLNYGMKARKLAADLGISVDEAELLIEKYMARYPAVQEFYGSSVQVALEMDNCSYTVMGRRRHLPELVSNRDDERWKAERQACNFEIQGTAADVVRMAMILIDDAQLDKRFDCHMRLQVHDELVFDCPKETLAPAMAEIREWMEHSLHTDLPVPLTVSMKDADTWSEAK
jgi:DNA polymerase-1